MMEDGSYPFIKKVMTWSQAEEYCKGNYDDLGHFNEDEMNQLSEQEFPIWIGLHRNGKIVEQIAPVHYQRTRFGSSVFQDSGFNIIELKVFQRNLQS